MNGNAFDFQAVYAAHLCAEANLSAQREDSYWGKYESVEYADGLWGNVLRASRLCGVDAATLMLAAGEWFAAMGDSPIVDKDGYPTNKAIRLATAYIAPYRV